MGAVTSKRFSSLNKDTNVAVSDFQTNGDVVTNKSGAGINANTTRIQTLMGNNTIKNTEVKGSNLPGKLANLAKPNQALDTIVNSLSTNNGVMNILSGTSTNSLYNSTIKNYQHFGGSNSPNEIRNKVKKGVAFNKFLEEECKGDIDNLISALNRLGLNLSSPVDVEALLAMLLALLARLVCNDITGSFSSLLTLVTGTDNQRKFGARGIGLSAAIKNPNLLIDIANSSVGGSIKNVLPAITGVALTSAFGLTGINTKQASTIFTDFNGALTKIDPSWAGTNGVNAGIHKNSHGLGPIAVSSLGNSTTNTSADINTAVGLLKSTKRPFNNFL